MAFAPFSICPKHGVVSRLLPLLPSKAYVVSFGRGSRPSLLVTDAIFERVSSVQQDRLAISGVCDWFMDCGVRVVSCWKCVLLQCVS